MGKQVYYKIDENKKEIRVQFDSSDENSAYRITRKQPSYDSVYMSVKQADELLEILQTIKAEREASDER